MPRLFMIDLKVPAVADLWLDGGSCLEAAVRASTPNWEKWYARQRRQSGNVVDKFERRPALRIQIVRAGLGVHVEKVPAGNFPHAF